MSQFDELDEDTPLRRILETSVIARAFLLLSSVSAACFFVVYAARPIAFSAVTIFPAWSWILFAFPLILFFRRKYLRYTTVCASAWIVFVLWHVEEPRSVLRGFLNPPRKEKPQIENVIRLVTFNCAGGQPEALDELKSLDPDIVFLQESPREKDIAEFAEDLFGDRGTYIWGPDTSIVAEGDLTEFKNEDTARSYCHGVLTSKDLGKLELVSLRLLPRPAPRIDLWNPSCWSSQRKASEAHRRVVKAMVENLDGSNLLVIAGDFNSPQGDQVFSLLPKNLYDSFKAEGRGIGNTILNNAPVLRIDQIWVSDDFETIQSFALKSDVSDHRIVISDVKPKS